MSSQTPTRRQWLNCFCPVALFVALFFGSFIADRYRYAAAVPPDELKTLDDFCQWKQGAIKGRGTFTAVGTTYTVMLSTAGRYLESGPAAYLFDENGRFVDWTSDKDDFSTEKLGLMLNGDGFEYVEPKSR